MDLAVPHFGWSQQLRCDIASPSRRPRGGPCRATSRLASTTVARHCKSLEGNHDEADLAVPCLGWPQQLSRGIASPSRRTSRTATPWDGAKLTHPPAAMPCGSSRCALLVRPTSLRRTLTRLSCCRRGRWIAAQDYGTSRTSEKDKPSPLTGSVPELRLTP